MVFRKLSKNEYIVRLRKGEDFFPVLENFFRKQKIRFAWLMMIGGLLRSRLAAYDLKKKKYLERELNKNLELVSGTGNMTWVEGRPFLHIHAVLSDATLHTYAGHLRYGIVGATFEAYIKTFDEKIERKYSRDIGLKLLNL